MNPNKFEINNILKSDSKKRYKYLINKICDNSKLFVLDNDGFCTLCDPSSNLYLPVWPNYTFAILFATEDWGNHTPIEIEIHEFMYTIAKNLTNDGINICPFPVTGQITTAIKTENFISDVLNELDKIE